MTAPLEIALAAPAPRALVGASVALELSIRVNADLAMETVELNRSRTRLLLETENSESRIEWSGQNYIGLHQVHPLRNVGSRFHAAAGREWKVALNLFDYTRPLPVGRYRLTLSYRYGETDSETVRTNTVAFEIVPAELLSSTYRWFGGSDAYQTIGSLWTARDENGAAHWFYQTASKDDPGVVDSAADLNEATENWETAPRLAHLNGIADFHFDRYVVWTEAENLCWFRAHSGGRLSETKRIRHGLAANSAILAESPLHCEAGGCRALLTGQNASGQASAALVAIDADDAARVDALTLDGAVPSFAVVLWKEAQGNIGGILHYAAEGERQIRRLDLSGASALPAIALPAGARAIAIAQWSAQEILATLVQAGREMGVLVQGRDAPASAPVMESSYDLDAITPPLAQALPVISLLAGPQTGLILRSGDEGVVLVQGEMLRLALGEERPAAPRLFSTKDGYFLIEHDSQRGFVATRLSELPEAPML